MSAPLHSRDKLNNKTERQRDTVSEDGILYYNNPPPRFRAKVERYQRSSSMSKQKSADRSSAPSSSSKPPGHGAPAYPMASGSKDNPGQRNNVDEAIKAVETKFIWNPAFPNNHRPLPQPKVSAFWSPEKNLSPKRARSSSRSLAPESDTSAPSNAQIVALDLSGDRKNGPESLEPGPKSITNGTVKPSSWRHIIVELGIEDLTNKYIPSRNCDDKHMNGGQATHSPPKSASGDNNGTKGLSQISLKENIEESAGLSRREGPPPSMPRLDEMFADIGTNDDSPGPSGIKGTRSDWSPKTNAGGARKNARRVEPRSNLPTAISIPKEGKIEKVSFANPDERPSGRARATILISDEVSVDEVPTTVSTIDGASSMSGSSIISIPDEEAMDESADVISIASRSALEEGANRGQRNASRSDPQLSIAVLENENSVTHIRNERSVNKVIALTDPTRRRVSTSETKCPPNPPSTVSAQRKEQSVEPMDCQDPRVRAPEAPHTSREAAHKADSEFSENTAEAETLEEGELGEDPLRLRRYRAKPRAPRLPKMCYISPEEVAAFPEKTRNFEIHLDNILDHMMALSVCESDGHKMICSHCPEGFTSWWQLREHLGRVTNFMPYNCKLCKFKCVAQRTALRHLHEDHNPGKDDYRRRR